MSHPPFLKYLRRASAAFLAFVILLQASGCSAAEGLLNRAENASSALTSVLFDQTASSGVSSAAESSSSSRASSASASGSGVRTVRKIAQTPASAQPVRKFAVSQSSAQSAGYGYLNQRSACQSLALESERILYSLIGQSAYQVADEKSSSGYYPAGQISVSGRLSEAQIRLTLMAYTNDNPQVFWLANAYSYGYRNNETILQIYSILSQSECNAAVKAFNSKLESAVKSIPSGLGQLEREEYLFHYITANCSYDYAAASDTGKWQAYCAYGVLVDGKAVCEGYSRAMQLLSSYAGLQCILIRGSGTDGVPHMWNGINIDGSWYHLDVTWCDSTILYYNYFNVTDSIIGQTHNIGPAVSKLTDAQICAQLSQYNLTLPACTAIKANYFYAKGIPADSSDSAIVSAVAEQMKAGRTTLAFYINGKLNYDRTVSGLVTSAPYKMWTYLQKAAALNGKSLNIKQSSYVPDKADRGLNIHIAYQ